MATFENRLSRRKGKHGDDVYRLDTKNKTPEENIIEIIQGLYLKKPFHNDTSPTNKNIPGDFKSGFRYVQKNSSDRTFCSYLNALVILLRKEERNDLGFTTEELMTCIRVSLIDDSMVIRAAALRVLRYLIKTESDVATFNFLKLPYLVVRSMDLMLRNEEERAQALRVVRRVIAVVGAGSANNEQGLGRPRAAYVDQGLLRCLAAVARAGSAGDGTGDRLSRPAIATLAEICVLNPDLFISCGGVTAVTRQLAECATPRMAEALCGVLLHTLNDPISRNAARVDLTCLSSPYCDFHFRPAGTDTSRDEREMRFTCSRLALLCVLRSWPGLLHFCHPRAPGGLRALIAALHLPRLEVRKAILDLLYELVGLPQPEWTDEISVALGAVDPSDFQDSWRLNEGFVAAEGISILPHLSATGPDIIEIHLALLLQCFLEAGLLDGLAEVIVTSDTFISVRATVLLGQLLHLVHLYLPPQVCSVTPALPTLISQAAAGTPQALAAVAALRRLHSVIEARPAASSLFLDHIIQYCSGVFKNKTEHTSKSRKEKDNASMVNPKVELYKDNSIEFFNESDNEYEPKQRHSVGSRADLATRNVSALVKSRSVSAAVRKVTKSAKFFSLFERDSDSLLRTSLVMQNKDGNTWNWEIIRTILKETDSALLLNLNDSGHRAWAGRIVNYLKPSSTKYSHTDLSTTCYGHSATRAGCQLIRHLLRQNDADSLKLLEDLFRDVSRQIEAIETGRKAHECLFSPQHMCNTMCQMYFLFIGQLCHTHSGLRMFKQTKLYENLLELSTKTHHSCYVKLVVTSLDYTLDACPRDILAKTLTCNIQASRLYATQFLNVLLRASRKSLELVRKKSKLKKNVAQDWRLQRDVVDTIDMDTWILQMLVGQIKDESKAVVKCALTILEEAYSVPVLFEKLMSMRDILGHNCRLNRTLDPSNIDWSAAGDRGYLLWLSLELTAAMNSGDSSSMAFVKKHLEFWNKFYNYRYVRLVEAAVHEALAAGAGGRRARARRSARPPPHALAALAGALPAQPARARSQLLHALPHHYKILRQNKCTNEQEVADLKASLWAVGNTALTPQGLQLLMSLSNGFIDDSVLVHIVRLAKYNAVYSVRATAFYVLGLVGSTYDGANLLSDLGWLCVRHTRHEQFPVIPEEHFAQMMDPNVSSHYFVTSPDQRFNTLDIDLSEHSDHTDHSTIESLYSENAKLNKTIGPISVERIEKDQDVVDHKTNFGERREPDKRKSHTLPSQGCSSSQERSLTESRTVDILRDVYSYDRAGHRMNVENKVILGRLNSLDHGHEGRIRNTSESSTSGVSSCDSFLGKYTIPDRVLTLSPIPSSSSLHGMKGGASAPRPRPPDSQRRTSTSSSFTTPDLASSPPTQLDMSGYATLRLLNKHRRPHVSECAATSSSDIDDLSWLLSESHLQPKPFSSLRDRAKSTRERMTKLSLLEYDFRPLTHGDGERRATAPSRAPPPPSPPHASAYVGICLPADLADLFPKDDLKDDVRDCDIKDSTLSRRVPSYLADSSATFTDKSQPSQRSQYTSLSKGVSTPMYASVDMETTSSIINRIKPDIVTTAMVTTLTRTDNKKPDEIDVSHNSVKSIAASSEIKEILDRCTEIQNFAQSAQAILSNLSITEAQDKRISERSIKTKDFSSLSPIPALDIIIEKAIVGSEVITESTGARGDEGSAGRQTLSSSISEHISGSRAAGEDISGKVTMDDSGGRAMGSEVISASRVVSGTVAGASALAHVPASCLACVRARPPSSHELRQAFFSEGGSVMREPVAAHAQLLHHVLFMSNPIHLRQTRSALLSLKQRHPEVFRSPCVYSDVCVLLSKGTYMLCARRFLQELFLDTSFDCFLNEPATILSRRTTITSVLPPTIETT